MNSGCEANPKTPKQWNSETVVKSFLNHFRNEEAGIAAGILMALKAMKTWADFRFTSSAVTKLKQAQSVRIPDLYHLTTTTTEDRLVTVRGFIKKGGDVHYESFTAGSPIKGVIWKKIVHKSLDVIGLRREISLKAAPMAISNNRNGFFSSWVGVDLKDYRNIDLLPLETVYKARFLDTLNPFFYGVKEEKILPIGKEVTAIGHVFSHDGNRIMPCDDMPFFLSELTKDQMLEQLVRKKVVLFYGGIALGSFSVCVLAVSFWRYWRRCKLQQKKNQSQ